MNFSKKNHEHQQNNIKLVSKKIILTSMLAISFLTATATQLSESILYTMNDTITKNEPKVTTENYPVLVSEEEHDEPFDFNTKDYLPIGFDATLSLEEKYDIEFNIVNEEVDEPFEFNTKDYLPVGFNLRKDILESIVEIAIIEEDESFDFDTKKYLPKNFNPNKTSTIINEL